MNMRIHSKRWDMAFDIFKKGLREFSYFDVRKIVPHHKTLYALEREGYLIRIGKTEDMCYIYSFNPSVLKRFESFEANE